MISRNYSEKISFITFFPFFINIFTNAPGLKALKGGSYERNLGANSHSPPRQTRSARLTMWQMWQMPRASGLRGPPEVENFFSPSVAK